MNPYTIGVVASDGHVDTYSWLISQSHLSIDMLRKIRGYCGGILKPVNSVNCYSTNLKYNLRFPKSKKDNPFLDWGIPEGNKTYALTFPIDKSTADIWLYLRGFFDGDGSISVEKDRYPRVQIISNINWCCACEKFLENLGIHCYVSNDKRHKGISNLTIHRTNSVHLFFENIYKDPIPLFSNRKYYRWLEIESICPKIIERRYIDLTQEDIIKIKEMILKGVSLEYLKSIYSNNKLIDEMYKKETGGRKVILNNREIQIEKLIKDGKTYREIHTMGIGWSVYTRVFKRIKYSLGYRQGIPLTKNTKDEIIRLLKEGKSNKEISDLVGASKYTIGKINREINGSSLVIAMDKIERNRLKVRSLLQEGYSGREINREYGISRYTISLETKALYETKK